MATPDDPRLCDAMIAFRLPAGTDPVLLRQKLWEEYRIEVADTERPAGSPGPQWRLRVSTHFYNTEDGVDRLAEAKARLLPATSKGGDIP